MIDVERHIAATPAQVWQVLADGWLYPSWVVGAARMRAVDPHWPAVGSRLHHSVGTWPLLVSDNTHVEVSEPEHRLVLLAKGQLLGKARVELDLRPDGDGCLVRMREDAAQGPGRFVPAVLRQSGIAFRNRESLKRLAFQAERRPSPDAV